MKTLLHLGGAHSQVPAIRYAVEAGFRVITCDYLPNNPGHELSHEYFNISTTDLDKVWRLADSLGIDGIASYASDPAAPTVGYVAERLGLVGPGFKAASILSHKGLFRQLMKSSGFRTPDFNVFNDEVMAVRFLQNSIKSKIVKPADSSGSKGVFHYDGNGDVTRLIQKASVSRVRKR